MTKVYDYLSTLERGVRALELIAMALFEIVEEQQRAKCDGDSGVDENDNSALNGSTGRIVLTPGRKDG